MQFLEAFQNVVKITVDLLCVFLLCGLHTDVQRNCQERRSWFLFGVMLDLFQFPSK